VLAMTLVAPNVLLAGEAEAGIEARAIPEERIKAMRRMGKPRVVDGAFANLDELNMPPNDRSSRTPSALRPRSDWWHWRSQIIFRDGQRRAQIVRHSGHDRSWPIDVERAVLLVELERRAGYWSLFARCCVGGRKQQREHGNCNCCGKTGATSEREKPRDDPTWLGVVIFAAVGVFARPLAELISPPTMRHHAETPATMIAYLMLADFRLSHHALARQFDGTSLR
jgi:hypothetical protein